MLTPKPSWRVYVAAALGLHWGFNCLVRMVSQGLPQDLSGLALLGLFTPVLVYYRPRWLLRCAQWFCVVQIGVSGLLLFGSLVMAMNPIGFHVHLFGVKLGTIWSLGGQFLYLSLRAVAFAVCAFYLFKPEKEAPNRAAQATPTVRPSVSDI